MDQTRTEIRCKLGELPDGLIRALEALDAENVTVVGFELVPDGTMSVSRLLTTDPPVAFEVLDREGFEPDIVERELEPLGPLDRWAFRFEQGVEELDRSIP